MIRLTAAVPGRPGRYRASAHVRVLRRLEHPIVRAAVQADVAVKGKSLLRAEADLVLVQRTALEPEIVEDVVAHLRRRGIPLVLELDDNLFLRDRSDPQYGRHLDSLARLVEAAGLVTVSTEPLRAALADRAQNLVVVPNALDERLWQPPLRHEGPGPGTRLLFFGTKTHADDLALLRPVIDRLRREAGLDVGLFVIGGEREGDGQDWYTRLGVPPGVDAYPSFVPWLKEQSARFDVGVAPLRDTEFNRSKSDLKFLEYSALGLAGVYSDVPAFASCVDGVTGLKTPNTVDGWCDALVRLCSDEQLRASLAAAAQEYVFRERCLVHSAADYADLLVRVARGTRRRRFLRTLRVRRSSAGRPEEPRGD